jgi:RNA-directed DNA polymerase
MKKATGHEPFIHVFGNLYVVPTPLKADGSPTAIEDFFDAPTLATTLNGKTFNRSKTIDETKHYGKSAFAREVVEKNAATINFTEFKKILDRIVAVIADYAKP